MPGRIAYIVLASVCILSCSGGNYPQHSPVPDKHEWYQVVRINSVKGYYEIYAVRRNEPYKIISTKGAVKAKGKEKIRVGEWYPFRLTARKDMHPHFGIRNYEDVTLMHGETPIRIDGGSRDLYYSDAIQGLYFIKDKKNNTE